MPTTVRSNLGEIARELRPKVSAAVKDGAEDVAELAKVLAPSDTGALKAAIHVERRGMGAYAVVAGGKTPLGDAWYGHLVEHGTARGGERGGQGERGPTPPHPFLVPALEARRAEIVAQVEAALREARDRG